MYLFGPEGLLILLCLSDHDNDDKFAVDNGLPTGLVIKVKMVHAVHFIGLACYGCPLINSSCMNTHALSTGYLIGVGLNSVLASLLELLGTHSRLVHVFSVGMNLAAGLCVLPCSSVKTKALALSEKWNVLV
ncbi:hypothetical protein EDD85DRAFT_795295 [Armillaria nabsnona]|nr:hypothetical protein EDD85DRAFT_795295 [Armillaria nabsnona]